MRTPTAVGASIWCSGIRQPNEIGLGTVQRMRPTMRCAMREDARAKSIRYLVESRLDVQHRDGSQVRATCRGDGEIYTMLHRKGRGWSCTCPARSASCAHLLALRSVVTIERNGPV